jgi:HSP20 family protein
MAEVAVRKQKSPQGTEMERLMGLEAPLFRSRLFNMNPFALMRQFADDMDRSWGPATTDGGAAWAPAIEVKRKNSDLVVTAELPGLKKDDVKITVTGDLLTLEGERKQEKEEKREGFYHSERSYGKFLRSIALPEGARTDQANAEFKDGMLEITIPVPEAKEKSKTIPVK